MNRRFSLLILVVLILGTNHYSLAQQAPTESPPNPYTGEVSESDFKFTHLSDADKEDGGTWFYERKIQNFHDEKLKVYWHSVEPYVVLIDGSASPRGENSDRVIHNIGGLGKYIGVKSSLEYGRTALANRKEIQAYIASEHSSRNFVWTMVKMALYFGEQKFIVNMTLVSRVKEGKYIYQIDNRGKCDISFSWDSAASPDFLKQTREAPIFLKGTKTFTINFASSAKPKIQSRSVTFLHPKFGDVRLGAALAPALVPSP